MFVTLVPIYIAEVAPAATRGLLVGQHGKSTQKTCSKHFSDLC